MANKLRNVTLTMLCLVFAAFAMSAAQEPVTIEVAFTGEFKDYEEIIRRFQEAHPEIKLDVRVEAFAPWEEKVKVLLATGSAPDAFLVSWAYYRELVESGALLDITAFKDRDYDAFDGGDIFQGAWDAVEVDGSLYGIPYTPGQSMIFYNDNLLQSAGLPAPTSNWTWDDFIQYGKVVRSSSPSDDVSARFGIDGSYTHWAFWSSHLFSHGGSVWNDTWDDIAINSEAGRETFTFMYEMVNEHQVTPPRGVSFPDLWLAGRTAFKSANKNWIRLTPERGGTFDLGVVPFPAGPHGQYNPGGVLPVVANATTDHPEAVWTLMKFLLSPEIVHYRMINEDNLPIRASIAREIEDWRLQSFAANVDLVRPFTTKNYAQMLGLITTRLSQVLDGQASVTEALETLEVELRAAAVR